jgi:hypothetical protein
MKYSRFSKLALFAMTSTGSNTTLLRSVFFLFSAIGTAQYTVTVLPAPPGILDDQNTAIIPAFVSPVNNKGQVAGVVRRPAINDTPVVWTNGVPTVLPVPSGFLIIAVKAINDAGQVVAQIGPDPPIAGDPNASQVVIWNGTVPTILPPLYTCPGQADSTRFISNAFGINRAGHVAGQTNAAVALNGCSVLGWIWDGSNFTSQLVQNVTCLGPTPPAVQPFGINDADHIVSNLIDAPGSSPCDLRASLIVPGRPLSQLAVPDSYTVGPTGNQINNLDQIYGNGPNSAFFWNGTSYVDAIVYPPGANFLSINNLGQMLLIKGGSPFIWQNGISTPITLPAPVLNLNSPAGLNDAGQIASYASISMPGLSPFQRIAVLTPVGPCATDVSGQIAVTRGGFRLNHTTGHYTETLTVTKSTGTAIAGPVSVVLDSIPNSATLYGPSGATGCSSPSGSPFVNLPSSLPANASVSVTLEFINPSNAGINYTTRVLAGTGQR